MTTPRRTVADRLQTYDRVVEIGVGNRPDVACRLAERGVDVTATDIRRVDVPDAVTFAVDDVTDPDPTVYRGAGLLYALNLPPELHRPAATLAREHDADCLFTTLGGDQPTVPVERDTLSDGETLYRVRFDAPGGLE